MIHEHGYWNSLAAPRNHKCSPKLAGWLTRNLDRAVPSYDFGCGMGTYLLALKETGFERLRGFEGDPPMPSHFIGIEKHDLTEPLVVEPPGNVICLEVAEHVPAQYADVLLDIVTKACADWLIFSWAQRGQGGAGHINELDNWESLPLLEGRGFVLQPNETREARDLAGADLGWFRHSLFVLRRKP